MLLPEEKFDINEYDSLTKAAGRIYLYSVQFLADQAQSAFEALVEPGFDKTLDRRLLDSTSKDLPVGILEQIGSLSILMSLDSGIRAVATSDDLSAAIREYMLRVADQADIRSISSLMLLLCPVHDQTGGRTPEGLSPRGYAEYHAERKLFRQLLSDQQAKGYMVFLGNALQSSMLPIPHQMKEFMSACLFYEENSNS